MHSRNFSPSMNWVKKLSSLRCSLKVQLNVSFNKLGLDLMLESAQRFYFIISIFWKMPSNLFKWLFLNNILTKNYLNTDYELIIFQKVTSITLGPTYYSLSGCDSEKDYCWVHQRFICPCAHSAQGSICRSLSSKWVSTKGHHYCRFSTR